MSEDVKAYIVEATERGLPIFVILEKLTKDFGITATRMEVEAVINRRFKSKRERMLEELLHNIERRKQQNVDVLSDNANLEKLTFIEKNLTGIERAIAIYLKNVDEKEKDNVINVIVKKLSE